MQSCCFGFVRGSAHFCSDTMTLGSGFPLKRGNSGNVAWSAGLRAKRRRMFLASAAWAPCLTMRGDAFLPAEPAIAVPQAVASGWDLQRRLLRSSWSSEVWSICTDLNLGGLAKAPARASVACNRESPRSELAPDRCHHAWLKERVSLQNLKSRPTPAGCETLKICLKTS